MSVVIAIGPISKHHGEAKMFNYSCDILKENHIVYIIDSTSSNFRVLRPWYVVGRLIFIVSSKEISQIYLSYSRYVTKKEFKWKIWRNNKDSIL